MSTYLFILGREPLLSVAELQAVLTRWGISYTIVAEQAASWMIETPETLRVQILMNMLGGTIKIAKAIEPRDTLEETIIHHLTNTQPNKIEFSLNGVNKSFGLELKKELKSTGRSVRYIEAKNTATILHNKLVEHSGDLTIIGKRVFATVAIQPIEAFAARDFGRPGSDSRSGMLPPKLAKMMINLATVPETATLLDPFCGSGTVLTEALSMGYTNLVGSDISDKAVADTKKNIEWINSEFKMLNSKCRIFCLDARMIDKKLDKKTIDAIVTEPFLGNPLHGNEPQAILERQVQTLLALYTETFHAFASILKPGAPVVMVIPTFRSNNSWLRIPLAAAIQKIGFVPTPLGKTEPYLLYARPDQHVGREIWRFTKQ